MGGQLKSLRLMTLSGTALLVVMSGSSGAHAADETSSVARGGGLVDEIVVSARRREERLQDVPASVASLSAESLEARGVNTTIQLTQVTPGLFMGFTGVFAQPVIRGIGSSSATAGDESNVATYIDGVYVSQMFGTIFKLANIERVEVLKGPQGTLYGRNATGGAISVTTKAPTFDATGDLSLTHGSFNHRQITGYYSAPISGKMAYSIAVIASKNSGYVRNIFDNGRAGVDEIYAVRAKLLFKPTDQLNFVLSVDAGQTDESVMLATTPLNGNTSARTQAPTALIAIRPYEISLNLQPFSRVYQRGVSLRSTLDLGWAELTSITARYTTTDKTDADSDASTALLVHTTTTFPSHTASQEFQLSSPSGSRLQWLVGALAFDSDATTYRLSKPAFTNFFTRVDTRAYAVYGEGTYDLTTALSVTAGLRYSYERKHNVGRLTAASPTVDTTEHWSSVTPRVIAKYEIPQAGNIYASFSRGFKSGQLNSSTLTGIAVAPETVSAYEIGAKTLFNGPLRISVAAFYYDSRTYRCRLV